jgi:DNA replication protein DnaC
MSLFYERLPLASKPNESILTPIVLHRALIGETYWDSSLDAVPDHLSYKDTVQGYIMKMHEYERAGLGMVFSGPFGTGKTALGCIVLREGLARRGRSLKIRCSTMVDRLWSKRPSPLPNGAPLREGLENVNFLFLDDFEIFSNDERAGATGAKDRIVEEILYARYERKLPTIIATNLGWDRLTDITYLKSLLKDRYWPVRVAGINWREKPPAPQTAT